MKTPEELASKVKLLKEGNADAFNDVYEESYKYLHTCVIHVVKNEDVAQDMLQDTYVEVFKNISQLKDECDFLSWAAIIANRKCIANIKKNRDVLIDEQTDDEGNESDYFESIADDESFIPENIFDNKEKIKMIRGIIDDLTDVQRACVIGFYYNDQKQDEIADQLGIPVNTVKSHLNRAKAKIKEAVSDIEKKQGVKLYSFSPFMLMLLSYEAKAFASKMAVPAASATLSATVAKGASTIATGAGKAVGKKTIVSSIKAASSAFKAKIAVGAAATVVGVTAVVGIVNYNKTPDKTEVYVDDVNDNEITDNIDVDDVNDNETMDYIDTNVDEKQIMDSILIYGKPLSEVSPEGILEYWKEREEYFSTNYSSNPFYTYMFDDGSTKSSYKGWDDIEIIGDIISKDIQWYIDGEGYFNKSEYVKPYPNGIIFSEQTIFEETAVTENDLQWLYEGTYTKYPKESQESYSERIFMRSDPYTASWSKRYLNKAESDEITGFNIDIDTMQYDDDRKEWGCITFDQSGMSIKDYLDSYIPGAYEKVKELETVRFKNGILTRNVTFHVSGKETWMFAFDDSSEISKTYPRVILVMDENEKLTGIMFETF
ncbi:MAG: sigma-70 family RNA polymerase sigma factor [Lachnospiraceae bacterium]|nr:sigma-70 family RNA polymerase sigma factor [Lachnospiraceae bacterium]